MILPTVFSTKPVSVRTLLLAGAVLLIATLFLWKQAQLLPDGRLHFYAFDVGQGDALLVVTPSGSQILMDGGPNTALLTHLGKVLPLGDRTIELLIVSHPHLDHLAALPDVLERYTVERVLLTGVPYEQGQYEGMIETMKRKHIPVLIPNPQTDISLSDGTYIDVVWPPPHTPTEKWGDVNNTSVVVRVGIGEESILLTGDSEEPSEADMLASGANLRSTILKVAHHGSKTSSSTGFLLAVQPSVAVVSVGKDNSYGHPSPSVVERLRNMGIPTHFTSVEGTIHLVLDGDPSTPVTSN